LTAFLRAVELDPGYFKTYQDVGSFYIDAANYHEAAAQFEKMVALAPNEPDAHYALGTAYSDLARYPEAEREFRFALRLSEAPKTLNNLGVALMYQGNDKEAIRYFSRALQVAPEWSALAWMNLGTALRRVNRIKESAAANRHGLDLAEKEMSQDPRSGGVRSSLAFFCARLGERKRAESEIAQALQLSPNDALTRWMAAVTYEALGQRKDTLETLNGSPDAVLADLSRWPDVADLRKDSRFLQLLASRQIK
jgi:serine/threonine-protein kinase